MVFPKTISAVFKVRAQRDTCAAIVQNLYVILKFKNTKYIYCMVIQLKFQELLDVVTPIKIKYKSESLKHFQQNIKKK